jgi:hypothetical protein
MLQLTPQSRIFLAVQPVDFRKGIDGLAALCRQTLSENGHFCPTPRKRLFRVTDGRETNGKNMPSCSNRLNYQTFISPRALFSESVRSETVRFLFLIPCLIGSFSNSPRIIGTLDTYRRRCTPILIAHFWNGPFWGDGQKRPFWKILY